MMTVIMVMIILVMVVMLHDGHFAYDDNDANIYRLLFHDARDDFHYALSASIHIN